MPKFYFFGELQRLIEETDLTKTDLLVYCKIANLPKGCFASYSKLAEMVGKSRRQVIYSVNKLSDLGLLERDPAGAFRAIMGAEVCTEECTEMHQTGEQKCTEVVQKSAHTTNIYNTRSGSTKRDASAPDYPEPISRWLSYRKEIKKPLKQLSIDRLIALYGSDPATTAAKIDFSIEQGYQGLFSPPQSKFGAQARADDYAAAMEANRKLLFGDERNGKH